MKKRWQRKLSSAFLVFFIHPNFVYKKSWRVLKTKLEITPPIGMATNNIMTYLVSQRTRSIGAVTVGASLLASLRVICSGSIARSQNFDTTHRATHKFQEPAKPCYQPILPQSPISAQANRGFSAPTFEAAIGGGV